MKILNIIYPFLVDVELLPQVWSYGDSAGAVQVKAVCPGRI